MASNGDLTKNDPAIARQGLSLLFKKGIVEAEALLQQHRGRNAQVDCGLAYILVLRCLMSWEEEANEAAIAYLKEVERRCSASSHDMPNIKDAKARQQHMLLQIVEADCHLLRALLSFTKMAIPAYVKGGVLLRSASKQYKRLYAEIQKMNKEQGVGVQHSSDGDLESMVDSPMKDVMAACSFGYGLFNLAMSLLPDKVLSLMKLLGFHGDRTVGLQTLLFAAHSNDMRAPMAMLAVLWYHSVGRAVLGIDVSDDYEDAISCSLQVLKDSEIEFADAPLFGYFRGRTSYLRQNPLAAMDAFTQAAESCGGQREVQHLCSYELGFIHVLNFQFDKAAPLFSRLGRETRWSPGYYCYLTAMCLASSGQVADAKRMIERLPSMVIRKNSNYEKFVLRKAARLKKFDLTEDIAQVLLLEVVFLWNYLAFSTPGQREAVRQLMEDKQAGVSHDACLLATSWLVHGSALRLLNQFDAAQVRLKDVLDMAGNCVKAKDHQIPAFALFELGVIHTRQGQLSKAKAHLDKAKSAYSDYEVESRLQTKVKAALEEVERVRRQ